jgi:1-hydroxycarotenoid 3,4-desaturase
LRDVGAKLWIAMLQLRPVDTLARHAWGPDGSRLDLFADIAANQKTRLQGFQRPRGAALPRVLPAGAAVSTRHWSSRSCARARPNPLSIELAAWAGAGAGGPHAYLAVSVPVDGALGDYFHDARLRQLFGRYATYCGSSPYLAPATLMLVAHAEQDGVWLLDGGMHTLATTLQRLAQARGASFRYGAAVHSIVTRDGRACGVRLANGETAGRCRRGL